LRFAIVVGHCRLTRSRAGVVGTPQRPFEQWLLRSDRILFTWLSIDRWLAAAPRWMLDALEFAYSTVYLVVTCGAMAMAWFGREAVREYWAVVLPAELISYAALPFLRSVHPAAWTGRE